MRTVAHAKHIVGALLALGLAGTTAPAHAVQKGDWLIRAGVARVSPNDSSGDISTVPGGRVGVDPATNLAINFTYMTTDNLGVELLGALPFKHDLMGEGSLPGMGLGGKIGETKELPPTLILLYNFAPKSNIRPYAGAGINYTTFFGEKVTGTLSGPGLATDLSLKDSTGLAVEAGVDVDIDKDWYFNASLWRMNIKTKATLKGGALDGSTVDVKINPWALFGGVGTKF